MNAATNRRTPKKKAFNLPLLILILIGFILIGSGIYDDNWLNKDTNRISNDAEYFGLSKSERAIARSDLDYYKDRSFGRKLGGGIIVGLALIIAYARTTRT